MEEEPATASDAVQSSELIEASTDRSDEAAARSDAEEAEQVEETGAYETEPDEPLRELPPADDSPEILRLEDDGGGAAAQDAETAPVEVEAEAYQGDAGTFEATAPAPLGPKPRRRRSSRRRGSGAGAAANAGANGTVAANGAADGSDAQLYSPAATELDAGPPQLYLEPVQARAPQPAAPLPQRRDGGGRPDAGGRPEGGGRSDFGGRGGRGDVAPDLHARVPAPRPAPWSPREPAAPESTAILTAREVAHQIADALREALGGAPDTSDDTSREKKIALFCDLENIAIGVRDSEIKKFDIDLVLERLLEKGKIIVKKAYADWQRYTEFKKPLHTAGIELIDIPQKYYSGKNSADIKMVVDAMDLCYSKEHLDTFVLLSGDSDFTPLVSKLKENNKHVIGVGVKSSSSKLLIDNCDEFLYYEDIWRDSLQAPVLEGIDEKKAEAFALMNDSIQALIRENKPVLWGSMVKQTMQRKRPSFNEGYYGYGSFSDLLEDAERKKVIHLKKDARSGSYVVTGFARVR